ncbi:MAG: hypoxanthine phosphoribosyltransferase [Chitinophagaceae bacterium]
MMANIQILDKSFVPYISKETIQTRIGEIAKDISEKYAGKKPVFLAILNGSFMFASDLFKQITIEAEISFVKLISYEGTSSSGTVKKALGLETDLDDRDVIIIEDIVDTGNTMASFIPDLEKSGAASIALATLLHKPEATVRDVKIDYCGFSIPDKFVVGYGLDYDQLGRNLPEIYQLAD